MTIEMQHYCLDLLKNPSKLVATKPTALPSKHQPSKVLSSKISQKPLTSLEKKNLVANIRRLPQEHLMGMIAIIQDGDISEQNELELDIDNLSVERCRELDNYVRQRITNIQENKINVMGNYFRKLRKRSSRSRRLSISRLLIMMRKAACLHFCQVYLFYVRF
jgi:hypothetical protein